ncbi:GNAT family N-acetyltransferase [Paraferrimonas sedimenticola]|uniref:Acetyltransferase n=1 Tax=Paraferrimonas sedimenticola TaxID=375674 RepID=A0AA37RV81_9GAMM|nr:GNAT family N-acetyltransferase [Paraferrimonas sedimenticola]GLP95865.1 acetyltransferase [Paraferrimonas sedimenticola]
MSTPLQIRPYRRQDAKQLTEIFYQTIHSVGHQYYNQAQVNAWAPLPINYEHWQQRLDQTPPLVAVMGSRIVGFMTLAENGHIEWSYTHSQYQRQGIASQLYQTLEQNAQALGLTRLTVNASRFAEPFFTRQGFTRLKQLRTLKDGQELVNWQMEKYLPASE